MALCAERTLLLPHQTLLIIIMIIMTQPDDRQSVGGSENSSQTLSLNQPSDTRNIILLWLAKIGEAAKKFEI